jgi:hypothetical protein
VQEGAIDVEQVDVGIEPALCLRLAG